MSIIIPGSESKAMKIVDRISNMVYTFIGIELIAIGLAAFFTCDLWTVNAVILPIFYGVLILTKLVK